MRLPQSIDNHQIVVINLDLAQMVISATFEPLLATIVFVKIRWRVKLKAVVCLESLAKLPKLEQLLIKYG